MASEVQLLRAEHDNIAQLLLVIESHLALIPSDEAFDGRVLLDALDYLTQYVDEFHRAHEDGVVEVAELEARHDAVHASAVELRRRLARVLEGTSTDAADVVRSGYAHCAELRRLMAIEEHALSATSSVGTVRRDEAVRRRDEARYRSMFEALTRRVGCDCDYEEY